MMSNRENAKTTGAQIKVLNYFSATRKSLLYTMFAGHTMKNQRNLTIQTCIIDLNLNLISGQTGLRIPKLGPNNLLLGFVTSFD